MEKQEYRELLPLVNHYESYTLLKQYAEARIKYFRIQLGTEASIDRIRMYQGAIKELERILSLRDEVIEKAK